MYVIVLCKTPQEGSQYAKRANLPRGSYRVATRAAAIKGLKVAEIHILPSFHQRPDRFAIEAALRYTRGARLEVEMPELDLRIHDVDEAEGVAYLEDERREAKAAADAAAEKFVAALDKQEAARGEETGTPEPREEPVPAPEAKPTAPRKRKTKSTPDVATGFF